MKACLAILFGAVALLGVARATPVLHRHYDPVKQLFGLPAAAPRLAGQHSHLQVDLSHASVFMGGQRADEFLYLDGESSELAIRYHRRLDDCWSLGVGMAMLAHNAGWFDRAIDDWHQFFGLPDGDRDESPYFRLLYDYHARGEDGYRVASATGGIGDTQVSLLRRHGCASTRTGKGAVDPGLWRVGVKLPSGDPARFTGSGTTDLFADYQTGVSSSNGRWQFHYSAGLLHPGRANGLPVTRPLVLYGMLAADYAWRARTHVLLQLDAHSPLFDSDIRELGMPGLQLTVGLRYTLARGDSLEFTIAEDAAIDTAPDIVARIGWQRAY